MRKVIVTKRTPVKVREISQRNIWIQSQSFESETLLWNVIKIVLRTEQSAMSKIGT